MKQTRWKKWKQCYFLFVNNFNFRNWDENFMKNKVIHWVGKDVVLNLIMIMNVCTDSSFNTLLKFNWNEFCAVTINSKEISHIKPKISSFEPFKFNFTIYIPKIILIGCKNCFSFHKIHISLPQIVTNCNTHL